MKVKQVIRLEFIEEVDERKLGGGTKEEKYQKLRTSNILSNYTNEVKKFVEKLEKKGLKSILVDYHSEKFLTPAEHFKQMAEFLEKIETEMEENK